MIIEAKINETALRLNQSSLKATFLIHECKSDMYLIIITTSDTAGTARCNNNIIYVAFPDMSKLNQRNCFKIKSVSHLFHLKVRIIKTKITWMVIFSIS